MALFGADFTSGALPLAILAGGQLVNALTGPISQLLMATGQEAMLRNLTLTMALINVPLNFIFAPRWGAEGSALATALSVAAVNLGAYFIATRKLNITLVDSSMLAAIVEKFRGK